MSLTNKHSIPLSVAVWLADSDYDFNPDSRSISATSLLKPIKPIILGRRVLESKEIDISTLLANRLGQSIHTAINASWSSDRLGYLLNILNVPKNTVNRIIVNPVKELPENALPVYMEIRTNKEISGFNISGKFDMVIDGSVRDFKTTKTYTYTKQTNMKKFIQQGSIYRWLNPNIIVEDTGYVDYIFTDWMAGKARIDANYPQIPTIEQPYELMSIKDTEQFIKNKIAEVLKYVDSSEPELPVCTSEDLWENPTVYKYYKNPNSKVRSTKNFDNYSDALDRQHKDNDVGEIVAKLGSIKACKYCAALSICQQAKTYIQEGRLDV